LTNIQKILKYQMSQKSVWWKPRYFMQRGRHDQANCHLSQFCNHA